MPSVFFLCFSLVRSVFVCVCACMKNSSILLRMYFWNFNWNFTILLSLSLCARISTILHYYCTRWSGLTDSCSLLLLLPCVFVYIVSCSAAVQLPKITNINAIRLSEELLIQFSTNCFGAQWSLNKRICSIDLCQIYIIGRNFGSFFSILRIISTEWVSECGVCVSERGVLCVFSLRTKFEWARVAGANQLQYLHTEQTVDAAKEKSSHSHVLTKKLCLRYIRCM